MNEYQVLFLVFITYGSPYAARAIVGCGSSDTNLLTGGYLFTFLVQSINYYYNLWMSQTGGLLHCFCLYHCVLSGSYDVVAPDGDGAFSFVFCSPNICCAAADDDAGVVEVVGACGTVTSAFCSSRLVSDEGTIIQNNHSGSCLNGIIRNSQEYP